jgi:predicted nucleic acid-binding protein
VIAIDTSVAVAALVGWHSAHRSARRAAAGAQIPAHARLETYSVLTRMPGSDRLGADVAADLLANWFPANKILAPSPKLGRSIVERCFQAGIEGGAVYDALIGLTVAEAKGTLLTRDERAARTYRSLDIDFQIME